MEVIGSNVDDAVAHYICVSCIRFNHKQWDKLKGGYTSAFG